MLRVKNPTCFNRWSMSNMKLNRTNLPLRGLSTKPNKNLESKLKEVKGYKSYPKQGKEHNALYDAFWNKKLHEFIKHEIG